MSTELLEPIVVTDEQNLELIMREIRVNIAKLTKNADTCEGLLRRLPPSLRERATINTEWMNFYNCNHAQAVEIMRLLSLGRWNRKINDSHSDRVNYATEHKGLTIEIWGAEPPASCRIVEETVEVPAQTITKRRLICSPE